MRIAAIVFDLDETLIHEAQSVEAAFEATCGLAQVLHGLDPRALRKSVGLRAKELWHGAPMRRYCLEVGISSWEGLGGAFTDSDPSSTALAAWVPRYRVRVWTRALADHGVNDPSLAKALARAFPVERQQRHVPFPDTKPTLDTLRSGYRLALLTNGAGAIQRAKIDGAGLASYFDPTIVSGDVGVGKPDPRIFRLVLEKLTLPGERVVMVGDSLTRDIQGAMKVGLRAVWLNRFSKPGDREIVPDAVIAGLADLPAVLTRLYARPCVGAHPQTR